MSQLSERAREECRREIVAACRLSMDAGVLDAFLDKFTANFVRLCDGPNGATYWAQHGQAMRDNGRFIGTIAEYLAKNKAPRTVSMHELMVGLIIVRATCDDRLHLPATVTDEVNITPFFELCRNLDVDTRVAQAWTAFLAAVSEGSMGTASDRTYRMARGA
jgi:hypothetical protein